MKNAELLRKYNLKNLSNLKGQDYQNVVKSLVDELYFEYQAHLETTEDMTIEKYDRIYSTLNQKWNSLGNKIPFGVPSIVFQKLDKLYYHFFEKYFPSYFQKMMHFQNCPFVELYNYVNNYSSTFGKTSLDDWEIENCRYIGNDKIDRMKLKIDQLAAKTFNFRLTKEKEEAAIRIKLNEKERFEREFQWRKKRFNFWEHIMEYALSLNAAPSEAFQILELKIESTIDDVKAAYRKLSMVHHPDKGGSQEKFIELTEAKNKCLTYLQKV